VHLFATSGLDTTFSINFNDITYEETPQPQFSVNNSQTALILHEKHAYDIDLFSQNINGLLVGENAASMQFPTSGNLPVGEGAVLILFKPKDWDPSDNKVHTLLSTVASGNKPGKLFIYKYKTSGMGFHLTLNTSGENISIFQNSTSWAKDQWQVLIFSFNKDEAALYFDGKLIGRRKLQNEITWPEFFSIGPFVAAPYAGYDGQTIISQVKIYKQSLNEEQAAELSVEHIPGRKTGENIIKKGIETNNYVQKSRFFSDGMPKMGMTALDKNYVPGRWSPVLRDKNTIQVWNRKYSLAGSNVFDQLHSANKPLLISPAYLECTVDKKIISAAFSEPDFFEEAKGIINCRRKFFIPGAAAEIEYSFEYDGLVLCSIKINANKTIILEKLRLIFPFQVSESELLHYVGAPLIHESQSLPRNSYSMSIKHLNGVVFESRLRSLIWLGNNDRGLTWFTESDKWWWPKDNPQTIIIKKNEIKTELQISMIAEERTFLSGDQITFTWGLMATPVKTMPKDWRGWRITAHFDALQNEQRGNHLVYWNNFWRRSLGAGLDPEPHRALNIDKIKSLVAQDSAQKRKIMPYMTKIHVHDRDGSDYNPDAEEMAKLGWTLTAAPEPYGNKTVYCASSATGWADYLVWCNNEWAKLFGKSDGVYLDEVMPVPNYRNESGGGYTDYDKSKRRPTYDFLGSRNMLKRFRYTAEQRNNCEPSMITHCSATMIMPYLSHFEMMLIGEHYVPSYFKQGHEHLLPPPGDMNYYYSYVLPMDRLRTEAYWKQWGSVIVFLPEVIHLGKEIAEGTAATRDMLSRILQADVIIWPNFCNLEEIYKVWQFRSDFGIDSEKVEFHPYWEQKKIISDKINIVIGFYQQDDTLLVLVSNLNREEKEVKLKITDFKISSIKNAETLASIPYKLNEITILLKRNDYTALRINY